MRKVVFYLFAALLVVGLPLSALAWTDVYRVADGDLNSLYEAQSHQWSCFYYYPGLPNLAAAFADQLVEGDAVCLKYIDATYSQTVRIKTNKDASKDLGWNLVGHGTVQIWKSGWGGPNVAVSAIQSTMRMFAVSNPTLDGLLYEGPVQVEQVVQDEGNDAACYADAYGGALVPPEGTPLDFFTCGWGNLEYVMHHWKLTGNKIAFNKITIKNGVLSWRDEISGNEFSMPMQ